MYVTKEIQNNLQKRKINVHQRSIFRQMMNTCDKLQNSFLSKCESKRFDEKQKEEKIQIENNSLIRNTKSLKRLTHDPFSQKKDKIFEDSLYVKESKQVKQIKVLRQKMIPKVNKTNIQKKLKELTFIRNMGYKTTNKRLQSFKALSKQQDQQNIINKSWESFYHDRFYLSPTQTPLSEENTLLQDVAPMRQERNPSRQKTKKPTYFLLSKALEERQNQQKSFNTSLQPKTLFQTQSNFNETSQSKTLEASFSNNFSDLTMLDFSKKQQKPTRIANRNKTMFKKTMKSLSRNIKPVKTTPNTKRYPLSSDRKKEITQKMGLNKEKLQKEDAYKLYKLIKGGYEMDNNDVQGEHISLKKFREAKQNFMMLNNCFNKIKQGRYIVQQPEKVFNDGSFKSVVYLTEIQNKIAPAAFRKIQQLNKVVN